MSRILRLGLLLSVVVTAGATAAACGSSEPGAGFNDQNGDGGGDGSLVGDGDPLIGDGSVFGDGALQGSIVITPADPTVDAVIGQPMPTVQFVAKTTSGQTLSPAWSIDRGEIGTIGVTSGVFTASGNVGGKATITASVGKVSASTSVTVRIKWVQNGDPNAGDAGGGAGGNGGVGGEGPGGAVSGGTQGTLQGTPVPDTGLAWLYPYDKTVWPRGILAPLLQWQPGAHAYDAIYIHLQETAFEYQGFFTKPPASPTFNHHPVPQDVWKKLAYSNQGEDVTVTLVFASGATAYGPITEAWKIAKGTLKGTVYYNSYGTNLAKNYTSNGVTFGAATLAIKGGATDPVLVAGNNTDCRVCHSVAASGSALVTEQGTNYNQTSAYALTSGNAETPMAPADGRFAWGALIPDGTYLMSNGGPLSGTSPNDAALYAVPGGAAIPSTGLPAGLRAGTPAFSPDGKHVAYNFYGGTGGDTKSLAALDFDPTQKAFSNQRTLDTPAAGTAVWPSFLPTNDAVVFELETAFNGRDWAGTRATCDTAGQPCANTGTQGELWWLDLATKTAHKLDQANGAGYLPTLPATQHTNDAQLNYEPTINPVPSGGYAWVVFTSRRLYGNVATINGYWSDPRFHDISVTPTPKKLWVSAIDLNAAPGTDPSHPAFYLPAQELLAGNSRGFWVVDPCHVDGTSCETGDECCGGFCQPAGDGGLVCTAQKPTCSQEFENCNVTSDCCAANNGIQCINGRCAQPSPK